MIFFNIFCTFKIKILQQIGPADYCTNYNLTWLKNILCHQTLQFHLRICYNQSTHAVLPQNNESFYDITSQILAGCITINSLCVSDTKWWYISGSTLVMVMAFCPWHQSITWTNVDFSSVRFSGINQKAISQQMPKLLSITSLKIVLSKLLIHLTGTIELTQLSQIGWYRYLNCFHDHVE